MRIEKSIQGSLFGITRLCLVMPNSDPDGWIFLSTPNSHGRFFFLHTLWSPAFDFNVGVAINESRSYTLTSTILKVEVVCDVAMRSTPNVLTTELCINAISHCDIKSHRIWPIWKPIPITFFKAHRIFRPSYNTFYEEINKNHTSLCL